MGCSRVPFIGSQWRVEVAGREDGGSRWWVITSSVFNIETKGGELTGRPIEEGKQRRCKWRFSSASRTQRRVAHGGARGGGAPGEAAAIPIDQG
jgi:hypothetical protein